MNGIKPQDLALSVSFDATQISSQLDWAITPDSSSKNNRHAGELFFIKGQQFRLSVSGYGDAKSGFEGFDILDCCIVTLPKIVRFHLDESDAVYYAQPSMFKGVETATVRLEQFSDVPPPPPVDGVRLFIKQWDGQMEIDAVKGRWDMSFMLTVHLHGLPRKQSRRVFIFDPETQVGDGSGPGDGD